MFNVLERLVELVVQSIEMSGEGLSDQVLLVVRVSVLLEGSDLVDVESVLSSDESEDLLKVLQALFPQAAGHVMRIDGLSVIESDWQENQENLESLLVVFSLAEESLEDLNVFLDASGLDGLELLSGSSFDDLNDLFLHGFLSVNNLLLGGFRESFSFFSGFLSFFLSFNSLFFLSLFSFLFLLLRNLLVFLFFVGSQQPVVSSDLRISGLKVFLQVLFIRALA
mgnify:CR=1 FL=1